MRFSNSLYSRTFVWRVLYVFDVSVCLMSSEGGIHLFSRCIRCRRGIHTSPTSIIRAMMRMIVPMVACARVDRFSKCIRCRRCIHTPPTSSVRMVPMVACARVDRLIMILSAGSIVMWRQTIDWRNKTRDNVLLFSLSCLPEIHTSPTSIIRADGTDGGVCQS